MSSFVWGGIGDSQLCQVKKSESFVRHPDWTPQVASWSTQPDVPPHKRRSHLWSFRIGSVEIFQASVNSSYLFATFLFSWPDSNLPRNCPCFLIQGTCCCSSWRHLWVRISEKRCLLSSSGRSINHRKAECKEQHAYIYIHYIPMIYLRCQLCKKQTLKHSWSLRFQTIFLIVQVVTNTTTRTPSTTTTATTTLTLNSRLVRMTLKQELWGDGQKRCMWKASAAESILQVYVHQRRSLATMEVHCAD